jgi:hypothetical protein
VDRREFLRRVLGASFAATVVQPLQSLAGVLPVMRLEAKPNVIQMVPVESIKIDWEKWLRPGTPSEGEFFANLVASIQEMGVTNPIYLNPEVEVIDGVYRVEAAKRAGLTHVPAVVRDFPNEAAVILAAKGQK